MIITYICRLETALPATLSLIRYVRVLQYMLARGTFKMRLRSFEVGQKKRIGEAVVSCPRVGFVGAL